MRTLVPLAALMLSLVAPAGARAQGTPDEDVDLFDRHATLAIGGHLASAVLGTASIGRGMGEFVAAGMGRGQPFAGLAFTLWGVGSTVSALTGLEQDIGRWRRLRPTLLQASEADRRVFREMEASRLKRAVVQRAIGLVADGTAVGIGLALFIVLPPSSSRSLGEALLLDGAFLLGVDLFRIVVDDQHARAWMERNHRVHQGWFGALPPPSVEFSVDPRPGRTSAAVRISGRF